jgi:hypothetical protein
MPAPADVEFVPMIWGKDNVTPATLAKAKREGDVLLGFNEPDMDGQANMSVEDALAAWPKLQDTGRRLGSPAVAYGGDTAGGWLDRFMKGAKAKGLRVDFTPDESHTKPTVDSRKESDSAGHLDHAWPGSGRATSR